MANSAEVRNLNRELRELHKDGILEKIYERQDSNKKKEKENSAANKENEATGAAKEVVQPKSEEKKTSEDPLKETGLNINCKDIQIQ